MEISYHSGQLPDGRPLAAYQVSPAQAVCTWSVTYATCRAARARRLLSLMQHASLAPPPVRRAAVQMKLWPLGHRSLPVNPPPDRPVTQLT